MSNNNSHAHVKPTHLLSSAKVVASAAKSILRHENDKVDKAKVAGDLLGAAAHYRMMEEKSYAKYVQQAENYLYRYHQSSIPAHSSANGHSISQAAAHSESGFGDCLKMAEGFLKKKH